MEKKLNFYNRKKLNFSYIVLSNEKIEFYIITTGRV